MIYGVILSGGVGSRMQTEGVPKQYLTVAGKPMLFYCLNVFERNPAIDGIVIVASPEWQGFLSEWIKKEKIRKFCGFANAGKSRQHSVFQGLQSVESLGAKEKDLVVVHDAARPLVSDSLLTACICGMEDADGVMPVIPVKDTIYMSDNQSEITGLLNRDQLYAGQSPECFMFGPYYEVNSSLTDDEMSAVRGSSEIAYKKGLRINLIAGSEDNFKVTTMNDLENFRRKIDLSEKKQ